MVAFGRIETITNTIELADPRLAPCPTEPKFAGAYAHSDSKEALGMRQIVSRQVARYHAHRKLIRRFRIVIRW